MFDFFFGPGMKFVGANVENRWQRDLSSRDVMSKRCEMYSQLSGGFAGGDDLHLSTMYMIGKMLCQARLEETKKVKRAPNFLKCSSLHSAAAEPPAFL